MKSIGIVGLAAAALVLGACGGGGTPHASCKDKTSALAYAMQWGTNLSNAIASGKVDAATGDAAFKKQAEDADKMGDDYGGFCTKLDQVRKDLGF